MSKYNPLPASPSEAGLFYSQNNSVEKRLGTIGHLRMDFGHNGKEFWTSWFDHGSGELNTPEFKAEINEVVNDLRQSVLKSRADMRYFCSDNGGDIGNNYDVPQYGYTIETDHYQYRLRCKPMEGDYDAYLYCFDKRVQEMNMANEPSMDMQLGGM